MFKCVPEWSPIVITSFNMI